MVAVTPQFSIEIAAQGSLNAKPSIEGLENLSLYSSKSASVLSYRLKGIIMVDPNVGITLEYRGISPDIRYDYGNIAVGAA